MSVLHPTKKIEVIAPLYAQKFVCVGSSCEDTCCAGWGVVIDKKTYNAYQKVKSPTLTQRLTHEIGRVRSLATDQNYARVKMSSVNQACPMLEDSLCAIQKELGEDKLSHTCSTFPRLSHKTGDFYQQSLTLSCPEAARLALLEDDAFEFSNADYIENLQGQQQGTLSINLHLGFESYKTEDTEVLQLKQDLNALVHNWSTPYNSRFLRRSEVQSFDHTNIQEFIITYTMQGFDYTASSLPITSAMVTLLITNNDPQMADDIIRTGDIPEAIALASELNYELTTETGYTLIIQQ
jgi:hypothetical protein